jgi:hypothetical protein
MPFVTFVLDQNRKSLYAQDANGRKFVAFTLKTSKSKPNLVVSRAILGGYNSQPTVIGTVSLRSSSMSSTIDVSIQGRDIELKRNDVSMSDRHSFEYSPMGRFE